MEDSSNVSKLQIEVNADSSIEIFLRQIGSELPYDDQVTVLNYGITNLADKSPEELMKVASSPSILILFDWLKYSQMENSGFLIELLLNFFNILPFHNSFLNYSYLINRLVKHKQVSISSLGASLLAKWSTAGTSVINTPKKRISIPVYSLDESIEEEIEQPKTKKRKLKRVSFPEDDKLASIKIFSSSKALMKKAIMVEVPWSTPFSLPKYNKFAPGTDSKEIEKQDKRNSSILPVIYIKSIPDNPSESNIDEKIHDEAILVIPLSKRGMSQKPAVMPQQPVSAKTPQFPSHMNHTSPSVIYPPISSSKPQISLPDARRERPPLYAPQNSMPYYGNSNFYPAYVDRDNRLISNVVSNPDILKLLSKNRPYSQQPPSRYPPPPSIQRHPPSYYSYPNKRYPYR